TSSSGRGQARATAGQKRNGKSQMSKWQRGGEDGAPDSASLALLCAGRFEAEGAGPDGDVRLAGFAIVAGGSAGASELDVPGAGLFQCERGDAALAAGGLHLDSGGQVGRPHELVLAACVAGVEAYAQIGGGDQRGGIRQQAD